MCGRFAAQFPPEFIHRLFATTGDLRNLGPNWNVAPTQPAKVIRRHLRAVSGGWMCCAWGWCRTSPRT
jgi:putative SOS response-associated peptidase YedK